MRGWASAAVSAALVGFSVAATAATFRDQEWKALLSEVSGSGVFGRAEMESANGKTEAEIEIRGATPGSVHVWQVHQGTCEDDQGAFGPAATYPPLVVQYDGTAKSQVKLAVPAPTAIPFFVSVHKSADDLRTIVSCGKMVLGKG